MGQHINEMLIKFNKSLPLALAAYNAGPNRVKIWIKRYGDPRTKKLATKIGSNQFQFLKQDLCSEGFIKSKSLSKQI